MWLFVTDARDNMFVFQKIWSHLMTCLRCVFFNIPADNVTSISLAIKFRYVLIVLRDVMWEFRVDFFSAKLGRCSRCVVRVHVGRVVQDVLCVPVDVVDNNMNYQRTCLLFLDCSTEVSLPSSHPVLHWQWVLALRVSLDDTWSDSM